MSWKKLDPIYWILKSLILREFYKVELKDEEVAFLNDNITKHRMTLWVVVATTLMAFAGLKDVSQEDLVIVITSLFAPAMVMGGAWFSISFGGIPAKLLDLAMHVTFWMFMAFLVSLTTMFIAVAFVCPPIMWPILAMILIGAIFSCIQYDTSDGFKAGLDEKILRHSLAALRFYKDKYNIGPEENE